MRIASIIGHTTNSSWKARFGRTSSVSKTEPCLWIGTSIRHRQKPEIGLDIRRRTALFR